MRITDRVMLDRVNANLQANLERLSDLQQQLSGGKRIRRPSDDPADTVTALRYRSQLALNAQYERGLDAARVRLGATDTALGQLGDLLQRAHELAVQGGTVTVGPAEMQDLAAEVGQLLNGAVTLGNTNFAGQYIFAGTKTLTSPFALSGAPPTAYTFVGNSSQTAVDIGAGAPFPTNVDGNAACGPALSVLIKLRNDLAAGDHVAVGSDVSSLQTALDTTLQVRGDVGARMNRVQALQSEIGQSQAYLQQLDAQTEDLDIADAVVKLTSQQAVYEAALRVAARASQSSLLDFLR